MPGLHDPDWCPVCGGEQPVAVGQPPEGGDVRHSRACPVRGPGWRAPPRQARPAWRDPAAIAAALAPAPPPPRRFTDADRTRVRQLRADGATYAAAGETAGVSKDVAWRWCNGR